MTTTRKRKPYLYRVFTLHFTRKLVLYGFGGVVFLLGVFFLLRFVPEKAFEFSSPYFGTIKTTATIASNYLSEIEAVRRRVDGQRDTIDAAFENSALAKRAATNAMDKAHLASLVTAESRAVLVKATNALELLQLVSEATAMDVTAYEALASVELSTNKTFSEIAWRARRNVEASASILKVSERGFAPSLPTNIFNPSTASFTDYSILLQNTPFIIQHCVILSQLHSQERFSKVEKLDYLVKRLNDERNILIAQHILGLIDQDAQLNPSWMVRTNLVNWWNANRTNFVAKGSTFKK